MFPSREAGPHVIYGDILVPKAGDDLNGEGFCLGGGDSGGNVSLFIVKNGCGIIQICTTSRMICSSK
jgi:hypothetical protein